MLMYTLDQNNSGVGGMLILEHTREKKSEVSILLARAVLDLLEKYPKRERGLPPHIFAIACCELDRRGEQEAVIFGWSSNEHSPSMAELWKPFLKFPLEKLANGGWEELEAALQEAMKLNASAIEKKHFPLY